LYSVKKYQPSDFNLWNQFVGNAKNATFLFHRNFMEYHKDRFEDFSLIVYKGNQLIGLLPANKIDNELHSHQGLTYGGLLISNKTKLSEITEAFKSILIFLHSIQILKLHFKLIPPFYTNYPSDEIQQILFTLQAKLIKKNLFSVIDLSCPLKIQSNRIEGVKKAKRYHLIIEEVNHFDEFWNNILIPNLMNRHKAKPTHTLNEIKQLKEEFPKNIRQFNVYKDGNLVGGSTIFETKKVIHVQYISGNDKNQTYGTLDFLFHELITKTFNHKQYFDFGSSTIPNTHKINSKLYYWKECFGARAFSQDIYTINTNSSFYLNDFLN